MIEALIRSLSPMVHNPPTPIIVRGFDGASINRLTSNWIATNSSIDRELKGDLDRLRARSRELARDDEYARKFVRMARNNIVGQGFIFQAKITGDPRAGENAGQPDTAANWAVENAFSNWSKRGVCEVTGRLSFSDIQRLIVSALVRDGEFILRKVRGSSAGNQFGFALQIIDIERLDTRYSRARTQGQNAIIMGIEVSEFGKPVAYHLFEQNPNDPGVPRKRERVPAEDILHGFVPDELEQSRGIPWMHAAMRRLNDLKGYREAAVIAARIGASKMGFYTTPDGAPPPSDGTDAAGIPFESAEPGMFGVLPEGMSFQSYDPAYPHDQFDVFVKACLRGIASGWGVGYTSLSNDLEGVNFSSIRSGVLEERDEWMVLQDWFTSSFLDPVFEEWLSLALLNGAVKASNGSVLPASRRDKFMSHAWQGRRWAWVDPKKDMETAVLAIYYRLKSPQQVANEMGIDIEDVLSQVAEFEQLALAKGVRLPTDAPQFPADAPQP